jgi:hypothetical protein
VAYDQPAAVVLEDFGAWCGTPQAETANIEKRA